MQQDRCLIVWLHCFWNIQLKMYILSSDVIWWRLYTAHGCLAPIQEAAAQEVEKGAQREGDGNYTCPYGSDAAAGGGA